MTRPALDVRWRCPLFIEDLGGADGLHVDVMHSQRERGGCGHWAPCPHKVHVDRAHQACALPNKAELPTDIGFVEITRTIETYSYYSFAMHCIH